MRALFRTSACVVVLTPFALLVAQSAFSATVTSIFNQQPTTNQITGPGGVYNDPPYCDGSRVIISGTGFASEGSPVTVTIGGVPAINVQVGSDTTIYAQLGNATAATGPADRFNAVGETPDVVDAVVVVTTPQGVATDISDGTTTDGAAYHPGGRITYTNVPVPIGGPVYLPVAQCTLAFSPSTLNPTKPTVTGISRATHRAGGKVGINGTGFQKVTSVTVGGVSAQFAIQSDVFLLVIVPKSAANGKLVVKITNPVGTATTSLIKKA